MTRKAVETGALWKPWKNGDIKQTTLGVEFFHRSHNEEHSSGRSFPQFPPLLRRDTPTEE